MINGIKHGPTVRVPHLSVDPGATGEHFRVIGEDGHRDLYVCTVVDNHEDYTDMRFVPLNNRDDVSDGQVLLIRTSFTDLTAWFQGDSPSRKRWKKSIVR